MIIGEIMPKWLTVYLLSITVLFVILPGQNKGECCILNENKEHSRLIFNENKCRNYSFPRLNNTICYLRLICNETTNIYKLNVNNNTILVGNYNSVIPLYDDVINIQIKTETNLLVDLYQEKCPVCSEITSSHFTLDEFSKNNCLIKFKKNSNRICTLHLDITNLKGDGYIDVGTERIWGNISGIRNVTFSGEFLILRNVTANLKGRLQKCSSTELNLLQLPVLSPVVPLAENSFECPGRIYQENTFTIISPEFPKPSTAHTCLYEIRKWRPNVCRLKLIFHFFWLGDGYNGVCQDGFLEVDGYRFCGCQSGLYWTTSVHAFRNGRAFLLFTSNGRSPHFSSYILTVEEQTCDYQGSYYSGHNIDYGQFYLPTRLPEICATPTVIIRAVHGEGTITSPEYPRTHSAHFLYRFELKPDMCGVEIAFEDFDLSNSWQCTQDFITLGDNGRYCGQDLLNTTIRTLGPEMWVSLVGLRGRGFLARYIQVDCSDGRPDENTGRTYRGGDHTQQSQGQCKHIYTQPIFTIQGPYTTSCSFIVRKSHPDICKVRIKLKDVDLKCGIQNLHINGQYYCGRILRDTFVLQFVNDIIEFRFNTMENKYPAMFTMDGEQLQCNLLEEQIGGGCVVSLTSSQGKVQSPVLYPRPPENLKCSYQFLPLKGICSIQLDFGDVNLPSNEPCTDTYLNINGQNYCGKILSRTSKSVKMEVNKDKELCNQPSTSSGKKTNPEKCKAYREPLKISPGKPVEVPYMVNKYLNQVRWNFTYTQVPC